MNPSPGRNALMLTGGGARAAYQAGFLQRLGELEPDLHFPILTGVSAGAINTACLASGPGNFGHNTALLADFWRKLSIEQVFRSDFPAIAGSMLRWGAQFVTGGSRFLPPNRSLVDPSPLRQFLGAVLTRDGRRLEGVAANIRSGRLDAVAFTTSNYASGVSTTWVEHRDIISWLRPGRCGLPADLSLDHVMASSALPLFFPAVSLENSWHGDGGIRLTAPFSPAIQLGATRILALATRPELPLPEADPLVLRNYPTTANVMGLLLDAVFLDVIDQDAHHLRRLNGLASDHGGSDGRNLRRVELLVVRPSQNLAPITQAHEAELPPAFRYALRGLGTRQAKQGTLLATVMFTPGYIREAMVLGAHDAQERHAEIAAFLRG